MSTKTAGDDFDPYEQNYTYTTLNPLTVKAYVSDLSPPPGAAENWAHSRRTAFPDSCQHQTPARETSPLLPRPTAEPPKPVLPVPFYT